MAGGGRGAQVDNIWFTKLQTNTDEYAEQTRSIKVPLMTASDAKRHNRDMKPSDSRRCTIFPVFHFCNKKKKRKILIQLESETVQVQQRFKVFHFVVFPGHSLVIHGSCRASVCRSQLSFVVVRAAHLGSLCCNYHWLSHATSRQRHLCLSSLTLSLAHPSQNVPERHLD